MGNILDFINTVRLRDNSVTNQNRDLQYDLDRRADRMERTTGVRPMDWAEFKEASPPEQPLSTTNHIARWALTGAAIGAIGFPIVAAMQSSVALSAGALALASGFGAVALGLMGVLAGVVDDQEPELRGKQLEKYKTYLDTFEKEHSVAKTQSVSMEQELSSKFRDMVSTSREQGVSPQLS